MHTCAPDSCTPTGQLLSFRAHGNISKIESDTHNFTHTARVDNGPHTTLNTVLLLTGMDSLYREPQGDRKERGADRTRERERERERARERENENERERERERTRTRENERTRGRENERERERETQRDIAR